MSTPLLDRIERHNRPVLINRHSGLPEPEWVQRAEAKADKPAWLTRLENKDMTAAIYSDGEKR